MSLRKPDQSDIHCCKSTGLLLRLGQRTPLSIWYTKKGFMSLLSVEVSTGNNRARPDEIYSSNDQMQYTIWHEQRINNDISYKKLVKIKYSQNINDCWQPSYLNVQGTLGTLYYVKTNSLSYIKIHKYSRKPKATCKRMLPSKWVLEVEPSKCTTENYVWNAQCNKIV